MKISFLSKRKKRSFYVAFSLIMFLATFFLQGCDISITPKITAVNYEGRNLLKESGTPEIDRTKELTVSVSSGKDLDYIWKIDDTVVLTGKNQDKFKFNNYRTALTLNSTFFENVHNLKVEIKSSTGRSDVVSLNVKFLNRAPLISLPDNITANSVISVNVSDPDEDDIAQFSAKIINSKGVVFSTSTFPASINIENYTLVPDTYRLEVIAIDLYGKQAKVERIIRTENNPPKVSITQPYQNELVPTSFVLKWNGTDPDPEEKLRYRFELKKGTVNILSLTTTATEAIVPNLEYDTSYTALVTVYDSFEASHTATVSFKTIQSPRYAYIMSKSFDGKSILNIANIDNLPNVKIEGFFVSEDNNQFSDFDVAEDYLYIVSGTYLYVVDASDKSNPKLVKKINFDSNLTAIKIYKNYAILGEGSTGIRIVDLTVPSQPVVNSKNFGKTLSQFSLEKVLASNGHIKSNLKAKSTNSKIEITQGKILSIKLSGTNAYIANDVGGLIKVNLSNLPNLTINDLVLIYADTVGDIDIGSFNDVLTIAVGSENYLKTIKLEDAENTSGLLPAASVTSLSTTEFDTSIKGVRILNNEIYAFTVDKIRKWSDPNTSNQIEFDLGSQFNDIIFVQDKAIVLDGSKGLRLYKNDVKYEPNKIYKSFDMNYLNNFIFTVGDGFYCNGLYVIDVRDNVNTVIRAYDTGKFLNKIDVKMKAVPKGSPVKVAKIVVANTEENIVKLYDFDYNTLNLTLNATLTLVGYNKVYDVAIDSQGRAYVLGNKSGNNVIEIFGQDGSSLGISQTLPSTINQSVPYFPDIVEPVEPKSIQVIVDYLSQTQKPSHVLAAAGRGGSIRYDIVVDNNGNISNFSNELTLPTSYYVVVEEQGGGYRLQQYAAGNDSAIAADKYFDRIIVADGDYNGIWLLDRNGANLTQKTTDNLTRTPLFAGAPARNVSWYGDLVFVSGGGAGIRIVSLRPGDDKEKPILIPFNGLTYAFHSEANDNTMVVATDKGLVLYDISTLDKIKPISSLNLPMFKIKAK
ncbi:MAG: hypothetical protein ACK4R7_00245 [Fervidobacterium sp.]